MLVPLGAAEPGTGLGLLVTDSAAGSYFRASICGAQDRGGHAEEGRQQDW